MPAPGTQRLFVAADPPAELAESLAAWAREQRGGAHGIRLVSPRDIHLTLAFLGEQPVAAIPSIVEAMVAATRQWRAEDLYVGEPIVLPPRKPRVLAATVLEEGRQLSLIHADLYSGLADAIGYSESRRFRPHLTLARLSRDAQLPGALTPLPQASFAVDELVLYRSHLEPSGARYEALERASFD